MWCRKQGLYLAPADVIYGAAEQLKSRGIYYGWTYYAYKGGTGYTMVTNGRANEVGTCRALMYNYNKGSSNGYMDYAERTTTNQALCWGNGSYYY